MASWVLAHPPWQSLSHFRFRLDTLVRAGGITSKQFLNTPTFWMDTETPMMKEIKAYPYPSVSPDASLFEDPDEGYVHAGSTAEEYATPLPLDRKRTNPCHTLQRLVATGKYEDANRVHAELVEHGVEIRPHAVYHFIARNLLDTHGIPSQARSDEFVKWWSLVPPKSKWDCRRSVGFMLTETLRKDAIPDLPLIARFALLAASKGYASQVSVDVIGTLAQFAPPNFTIHFLEQFCIAAWKYETSLPSCKETPQKVTNDLLQVKFRSWYSTVVSNFASTKNFAPAMAALKVACSRNIGVTQNTFSYLLRKLNLANEEKHVKDLESLWTKNAGAMGLNHPPTTTLSFTSTKEIPVPAHHDISAVAFAAKQLKQMYHAHTLVSARNLAALLDTFLRTGRLHLVERLRTLAYRSGNPAISTWALAEMIYYQRLGHKVLSKFLSVFEHHFYLVGVPQIIFNSALISEHRLRVPPLERPKGDLQLLGPPPTLRRRLQPSLYHNYMLWRTVTHGVRRPATLVRLYRSFIEQAVASRRIHPSPALLPPLLSPKRGSPRSGPVHPEPNDGYMKPIPPHPLYDVRFFNIFVTLFARFRFWPYLTRTIIDVHRFGYHQEDGTRNAFVQQLRLSKDMRSVHRLFSYWEANIDRGCRELEISPWRDESAEPFMEPIVQKPDPETTKRHLLTFFYVASIRRLAMDGRVDDAREVVERFLQVVPGRQSQRRARRAMKSVTEEIMTQTASEGSVAKGGLLVHDNPELDAELDAVPLLGYDRRR